MALPKEHQFEIMYGSASQNGYKFGLGLPLAVEASGFKPAGISWNTQDTTNHRTGMTRFGRDTRKPEAWTWDMFVNRADAIEATEVIESFARGWGMDTVFGRPAQVQRLRYTIAGRTRCIFGRPRRLSTTPDNFIMAGRMLVGAEFMPVDTYTYDEVEEKATVTYNPTSSGGGWTFPAVFPVDSISSIGSSSGVVGVGGNTRTYPVLTIRGPISTPEVVTAGWKLSWNGSLTQNDVLVIDTRPWVANVTLNGVQALDKLPANQWLEDCYLDTGQVGFRLEGASATGGATLDLTWRNAWTNW